MPRFEVGSSEKERADCRFFCFRQLTEERGLSRSMSKLDQKLLIPTLPTSPIVPHPSPYGTQQLSVVQHRLSIPSWRRRPPSTQVSTGMTTTVIAVCCSVQRDCTK